MKDKKILHFQLPIDEKSAIKDKILISPELTLKFNDFMKEKLGEQFEVIISPFLPVCSKDCEMYNFDIKQLTIDELKIMIENKTP